MFSLFIQPRCHKVERSHGPEQGFRTRNPVTTANDYPLDSATLQKIVAGTPDYQSEDLAVCTVCKRLTVIQAIHRDDITAYIVIDVRATAKSKACQEKSVDMRQRFCHNSLINL